MQDLPRYKMILAPRLLRIIASTAVIFLCLGRQAIEASSSHFSSKEFSCKCCGKSLVNPHLLSKLETLRHRLGDKQIIITSGFRCPRHNKKVGGVPFSQHQYGRAADIKIHGLEPRKVAKIAREAGFTFVKAYPTWTHIDVREGR